MMILDTNVVSELMRPNADQRVLDWLNARYHTRYFLTAVSVGEILFGISRLPFGKRKQNLENALIAMLDHDFVGSVLPFDSESAGYFGELASRRQRIGRPVGVADAQIAAICQRHAATLVTRNTSDFDTLEIELQDPWSTT